MKIKWFIFVFLFSVSWLQAEPFQLKSPELTSVKLIANEQVFNGFGCSGGNISPSLSWTGLPKDTKSIALTVYDPDAPTGSGWWHWVVFNLPSTITSIPANAGNLEKTFFLKKRFKVEPILERLVTAGLVLQKVISRIVIILRCTPLKIKSRRIKILLELWSDFISINLKSAKHRF